MPQYFLPLAKPRLGTSISATGRNAQEAGKESPPNLSAQFHPGNHVPGCGSQAQKSENGFERGKAPPAKGGAFALAI